MRNLNGTPTATEEGVLAFGSLPLWFIGGNAGATQVGAGTDLLAKTGQVAKGVTNTVTRSESVLGHIFRDATGHVNPSTLTSQNRYIQLFESVANNPANLNQSILAPNAIKNGAEGFTQTFKNGQIWVQTRNGKIFDAGVNLIPR